MRQAWDFGEERAVIYQPASRDVCQNRLMSFYGQLGCRYCAALRVKCPVEYMESGRRLLLAAATFLASMTALIVAVFARG
jgi:hypothetical protein